jgi:hypothetical protein
MLDIIRFLYDFTIHGGLYVSAWIWEVEFRTGLLCQQAFFLFNDEGQKYPKAAARAQLSTYWQFVRYDTRHISFGLNRFFSTSRPWCEVKVVRRW